MANCQEPWRFGHMGIVLGTGEWDSVSPGKHPDVRHPEFEGHQPLPGRPPLVRPRLELVARNAAVLPLAGLSRERSDDLVREIRERRAQRGSPSRRRVPWPLASKSIVIPRRRATASATELISSTTPRRRRVASPLISRSREVLKSLSSRSVARTCSTKRSRSFDWSRRSASLNPVRSKRRLAPLTRSSHCWRADNCRSISAFASTRKTLIATSDSLVFG